MTSIFWLGERSAGALIIAECPCTNGRCSSDFDTGARTVVPALRALGVDELELVVASHADTDHIEGLASVLQAFPVQQLVTGYPGESESYAALIGTAAARGVPVHEVRRGEVVQVAGASLEILSPPAEPFAESNQNSVAFVLRLGGRAEALWLGDMASEVEDVLAVPDVRVMMVSHHGSRFSTSARLLEAAQPEVAVLSYGRNNYGHPNPDVLQRLRRAGVKVQQTFLEGAVRVPLEE